MNWWHKRQKNGLYYPPFREQRPCQSNSRCCFGLWCCSRKGGGGGGYALDCAKFVGTRGVFVFGYDSRVVAPSEIPPQSFFSINQSEDPETQEHNGKVLGTGFCSKSSFTLFAFPVLSEQPAQCHRQLAWNLRFAQPIFLCCAAWHGFVHLPFLNCCRATVEVAMLFNELDCGRVR